MRFECAAKLLHALQHVINLALPERLVLSL